MLFSPDSWKLLPHKSRSLHFCNFYHDSRSVLNSNAEQGPTSFSMRQIFKYQLEPPLEDKAKLQIQ